MISSESFAAAVADGGVAALEAVRNRLAADLEECRSMRDKAALYRRLTDVLEKIDALRQTPAGADDVDRIALRRQQRRFQGGTRGRVPL